MNATDLMIGDWVLIKPEMKPIKVAAVHQKKIGYHVRADKLNWVRFGLLEPISLTPELLVANGFSIEKQEHRLYTKIICKKQGPKDSWFEDIGHTISFIYPKNQTDVSSEVVLYHINYDHLIKTIRYVHQLQHAFRMLQYDDLADNFKVI